MFQAETHIRVRGEMDDAYAALHRRRQRRLVENVAAHEPETGMSRRAREKFLPARRKIVVGHHRHAIGQQPVDEMASDETGRARDERRPVHRSKPMACSTMNLGRCLTSS
jgi:hypothetical protein